MFALECKLFNVKKKDDEINWRGSSLSQDKKPRSPLRTTPAGYLPLAQYQLFCPGDALEGKRLVLVRDGINGKAIHDHFGTLAKKPRPRDSYFKTFALDRVFQPGFGEGDVYGKSVRPLVTKLISGGSSALVVASPSPKRVNACLFRINSPGLLMRAFEHAFELTELLRKGGKYPKSDFSLKVKGFNVTGDLKSDVFSLNPLDPGSSKYKTLKLASREDMVEFCKIARNSTSVLKAVLEDSLSEKQTIQTVQLVFEVRDDSKVLQSSTLSIVRLIVNGSNSSMQPLSSFGSLINKTVVAKISQGSSATVKLKDPVAQHFAKIIGDCQKLHTLLLLQTADCFEETKAIMSYFKELLEARQLKSRHKSVSSKCEESFEDDPEELDENGDVLYSSKRSKSKKRVKLAAGADQQQQEAREDEQESDHEGTQFVRQKPIYSENSPKELAFNNSESLLQPQTVFVRPQQMQGTFEIPEEAQDGRKTHILERDYNEQRSSTAPDITREQLTEKIIREPHEPRTKTNKGYRSQQDMAQQKDSYVESHDQILSVPNDAIETLNRRINGICESYGVVGNKLSSNEAQLKQHVESLEAERQQRKALEAEVHSLRTEQARNKEAQSLHMQQLRDSLTSSIQDRDKALGQLKLEVQRLEHLLERSKADLSKETAESLKKDQQIKLLETDKLVLLKEKSRHDREVEDAVCDKEKLERSFKRQIEAINEDCRLKVEQSNNRVRTLEAQLAGLELKARAQQDDNELLRKDMDSLSTKCRLATEKQSELQSQNIRQETEIMSLKTDLERSREQMTHKDAVLRDLKRDNLEMLTLKKELDESRKNSSLKTAELQKQLSAAYEETKELKLRQKELKKQVEQKDAENDQAHLALESLNNRSDKDTAQFRSELERLSSQLRAAQDSLLRERSQSSKLKTEAESLAQTNRRLSEKAASLSSENAGLKSRLAELEALIESRIAETNHSLRHLASCQSTAKKAPQTGKGELLASVASMVDEYKAQLCRDK